MKVGVYFDLRLPPGGEATASALYGSVLELCEEADQLGCASIWLSEHHLFDDGYLPQPLTFAAAVAARTRRARIGTAILIAPLHHPVEVAEQSVVIDVLSDGRLDLGLGTGYRVPEFELYGAELKGRYGATMRCAEEVRRLWRTVTPHPVQPALPIWFGFQGPQGAGRAGRAGDGLLSADATLWAPYREGLLAGGHDPAAGRMAGGINGWVTEDPEADWPVVSRHVARQFDSYRRHMVEGTTAPVPRPVDPEQLRSRTESRHPLDRIVYGTPDEVAADVRASTAGAPVESVFFWASIAGMPHDLAARHVRTICAELAPRLACEDA
jgi:alkanesulfonate monooxygenase SsuD/methylene tetrahydromethanopterin reductase-like flavin-dependent oxidoreductase (luciferase family)